MKIISLNAWGGRVNPAILDFVSEFSDSVDVFCFQEMMRDTGDDEFDPVFDPREIRDTVETFARLLPDFEYRFANLYGEDYGLATFVRRDVGIVSSFEDFIFGDDPRLRLEPGNEGAHCRKILVTTLRNGIRVAHLHGMWIGGYGKGDHPERLEQSRKILDAVRGPENTVLIGDFNLNPETRSYSMFKEAGFECLVEKYGITSTRTELYEKDGKYADYALVSPWVSVVGLTVLPHVVSDHAALLLEIQD